LVSSSPGPCVTLRVEPREEVYRKAG
jgi:hypothetical protein